MPDTTNAHLTARDGYETALSPLRDILRQIKAGNVSEAKKNAFYPKVKTYMDAHPLPQDGFQYELHYLGLFAEFIPFAVKSYMDDYSDTFIEKLDERNIMQLEEALLASDAVITEADLDYLQGLIARAVFWIAPSEILVQGMVDQMLLSLIWQDEKSGGYILQRLMDGALGGAFLK